jgi:hypothetical protein
LPEAAPTHVFVERRREVRAAAAAVTLLLLPLLPPDAPPWKDEARGGLA